MEKKQIRDYMTHDVISIDASGTVGDVIHQIHTTDHDGFPVLRGGKVVGYISARDIIGEHPSTKVELRMTRPPNHRMARCYDHRGGPADIQNRYPETPRCWTLQRNF